MTKEEHLKFLNAYCDQHAQAKKRDIEWHFTSFKQWLDWWGDDIWQRGCSKGKLVMSRYGDVGPYHPNNIRKATVEENGIEANLGRRHGSESKTTKRIKTPLGIFESRRYAAQAHNLSNTGFRRRMRLYPHLYYDV